MFNVTPIGSCRITTPLRHGRAAYGINLNLARCYGYCHSPAEAVQLARFMQGEVNIPHEAWPLVSRSHQLEEISAQDHAASDLYVIELASAKELTFDGVSIQLNYLNSSYKDFFAEPERAQQFWALAETGAEDAMAAFLEQEWSLTREQRTEAETLSRIRLQYVTRQSLRQDIDALARLLPDVLFVSHVDARKPDGRVIGSRSDFIRLVGEEVERAGLKFYNPTDLMTEFGQAAAIEDDSTSLAHFTTGFSHAVMDDWMRDVIAPMTDDAVLHGVDGALGPQITAAAQQGRLADGRSRLEALSSALDTIRPMLDAFIETQEDAQKSFIEENAGKADGTLEDEARGELVDQAASLGLFELALRFATQPEGGLRALPAQVLIKAGLRAAEAGDTDNAFEFALAAYCKNPALTRASSMLADLAINDEIDLLSELTADQLAGILSHLAPVQKLQLLSLNGAAPTDAISASTDAQDVIGIAAHLAEHQDVEQAAEVIAFWRTQRELDRIRDKGIVALLDTWVEAALDLPDAVDRISLLATIMVADPRHPGLRNAMRDARVDLVHRLRDAGRNGDTARLDALRDEVEALPMPLPEYDLWRARLKFDCGEYEDVVELGQSAAVHMPETINVWVLLMRAAVQTKNAAKASEFASKVVALACGKTQKLKSEAEAVLNARTVGA
ncbi:MULTISPECIES: hypothetical protein [unclassified Roseovarius]|uniref:hypothetical protein n=1 Tax=unclassified Roseovarius TaxID=2614913 RepID=UPI00273F92F8|nr:MULTISPECIES: hypothetical protein [unclassified Roseovarius]